MSISCLIYICIQFSQPQWFVMSPPAAPCTETDHSPHQTRRWRPRILLKSVFHGPPNFGAANHPRSSSALICHKSFKPYVRLGHLYVHIHTCMNRIHTLLYTLSSCQLYRVTAGYTTRPDPLDLLPVNGRGRTASRLTHCPLPPLDMLSSCPHGATCAWNCADSFSFLNIL